MISRLCGISILFLFLFLRCQVSSAKDFDENFFRKNLQTNSYSLDTEAAAIVLFENTAINIEKIYGIYEKVITVHKIIKILKQDGLQEGNVNIYYTNAMRNISAVTYNVSGDQIIKSVVSDSNMLRKVAYNGVRTINFSMPALKVGSVIEYSYVSVSGFGDMDLSWHIQQEYPKLVSEFSLVYPQNIEFTAISHVHGESRAFASIEDAEAGTDRFCFVARDFPANLTKQSFWLRRDIDGIKAEPYVVNIKNHLEQLELQMTGLESYFRTNHFNNGWGLYNRNMWETIGLDKRLKNGNNFFKEVLDTLIRPEMSEYEKASKIFNYVRSQFKLVTDFNPLYKLDLNYIDKYKEGGIEEINLLLTAMLIKAGLHASPLVLSTTGNISPNKTFPVLDRLNYMACVVEIDSGYIFLDASDKNNCFGLLPPYCYNGYSWILGDVGKGINLSPDVIKDKTVFGVKIDGFTDSTAKMEITEKFGMFRSVEFRKQWAKDKEKKKGDIDNLKRFLPENIEIEESHIENENDPDANIIMKYSCELSFDKASNIFLNANLVKFFERNPFKAAVRKLPIEFPYKTELGYTMNITLPKNIKPDTLSEPVDMNLMGNAMRYKNSMNYFPELHMFTLFSSFTVNVTSYSTENYQLVKEFIQKIIDDGNKMVVFRKTAE